MKYTNNIVPEELERIERFLTNEMQEDEAKAFERELKENVHLQEKMEEIKLLLLGISESSLEEKLKTFHTEIEPATGSKKNTRAIPLFRTLLIAASLLVVVLSLWWFLQKESNNEKLYSKYYTPDPGLATVMSSSSNYNFDKAMVEYKNGEYDKAIATWKSLLKEKPGNDTLIYFIGAAYEAKKDYAHAIENLEQITNNTESVFYKDACWYLGLSYLKKGETNQAIEYLRKSDHPNSEAILKIINKK